MDFHHVLVVVQKCSWPCRKVFGSRKFFAAGKLAEKIEKCCFISEQVVFFSTFLNYCWPNGPLILSNQQKKPKSFHLTFRRIFLAFLAKFRQKVFSEKCWKSWFFSFFTFDYDTLELQKHNKAVSFSPCFHSLFVKASWNEILKFSKLSHRRTVSVGSFFPRQLGYWNVASISTVLANNNTDGFVACITGSVSFKTVAQLSQEQQTFIQSCSLAGIFSKNESFCN